MLSVELFIHWMRSYEVIAIHNSRFGLLCFYVGKWARDSIALIKLRDELLLLNLHSFHIELWFWKNEGC
jgi:hypothetical protein